MLIGLPNTLNLKILILDQIDQVIINSFITGGPLLCALHALKVFFISYDLSITVILFLNLNSVICKYGFLAQAISQYTVACTLI